MLSEVMIKLTIENIEIFEVRKLKDSQSKHSKRQVSGSKLNRYIFVLNKMFEGKVMLNFHLRTMLIDYERTQIVGEVDRKTFSYILQSLEHLGIVKVETRAMNNTSSPSNVNPIWNFWKSQYLKSGKEIPREVDVIFYKASGDYSEEFVSKTIDDGINNLSQRKHITAVNSMYSPMTTTAERKRKADNIGKNLKECIDNDKSYEKGSTFKVNRDKKRITKNYFEVIFSSKEKFVKTPGSTSKKKLKNFDFGLCKVMSFEYRVILLYGFLRNLNEEINLKMQDYQMEFVKRIMPDWNEFYLNKITQRPNNEKKFGGFLSSIDRQLFTQRSYLSSQNFLPVLHKKPSIQQRPLALNQQISYLPGSYEESLKRIDDFLIEEEEFYAGIGNVTSRSCKELQMFEENPFPSEDARSMQLALEGKLIDASVPMNFELKYLQDFSSKPETTAAGRKKFEESFGILRKFLLKHSMRSFRDLKLKIPKNLNLQKIFSILVFEGLAEVFYKDSDTIILYNENDIYTALEAEDWTNIYYKLNLKFYSYF
jgi:hypothetical protein